MGLWRSVRTGQFRASWMIGSAIITLVGTSTYTLAQETTSYSYDALGRLVSSTASGGRNSGVVMRTCFDAAGNRTQYMVGSAAPPCIASSPSPTPTPAQANQVPTAANAHAPDPANSAVP